jgi:hypothetical protein
MTSLYARSALKVLFLEYVNGFLTVQRFADHHEIDVNDARTILDIGKRYHNFDAEWMDDNDIS